MRFSKITGFLLLLITFSGCGILADAPKTELTEGIYQEKIKPAKTVYVEIDEDEIRLFPLSRDQRKTSTSQDISPKVFPEEMNEEGTAPTLLIANSFDVDFLTIPLKVRPSRKGVPVQMNTDLNGAVYLGYRTDRYNLKYKTNPLGKANRDINHFGFSFGVLTGFGATAMTPTTTANGIEQEYDGLVWSKGVAGIIAINSFTAGVAIGFDSLMDSNRSNWIYQNQPWFGLAFGLNIN